MRNGLPDLLGDVGHKGMEQTEDLIQHIEKHLTGVLRVLALAVQSCLCQLDIPVAVAVPNKFVDLLHRDAQLKLAEVLVDLLCHGVEGGEDPLVLGGEGVGQLVLDVKAVDVHMYIARRVPQLVGKTGARFDALFGIADVVARRVARHEEEAQRVGAVFFDDLQRINAVAQRLGHLSAQLVADDTVNKHGVKRHLTGMLDSGENHSGNPEEYNIIARHQCVGGVEVFQIGGILRPAERRERPQRRGEPGVERVLILRERGAAAVTARFGHFLGYGHFAAGVAVVGRNAVTPPELTRNAPILDVFHPVEVDLFKACRNKLGFAVAHRFDGGLGERLHANEPLLGDHRLDRGVAAVAGAHVVGMLLDLLELTERLQIGDDRFSRGHGVHTCVFAAVEHLGFILGEVALCLQLLIGGNIGGAGHVTVIGEHAHDRQIAALTDLVVVRVVRRRDLYHTGPLFHIGVLVAHDRDLLVQKRQDHVAAVQMLVALVLRVDRDRRIAEHRLGARGGDLEHLAGFLYLIEDMPKMAVLLLIFDLCVGDGGDAVRTPVYHAVAAVDLSVLIELDKDLLDRVGAALVHRKALAAPVAADAQLAQLACDPAAVFALPFPGALQKLLASQIVLRNAFLAHCLHDFCLGCDRGVVGAGQPKGAVAGHALPADQNILQRFVECVTDMQLTGDVRRRHDNGIGLFFGIGFGVKVVALHPEVVNLVLK